MGGTIPEVYFWVLIVLGFALLAAGVLTLISPDKIGSNLEKSGLSGAYSIGSKVYAVTIGIFQILSGVALLIALLVIPLERTPFRFELPFVLGLADRVGPWATLLGIILIIVGCGLFALGVFLAWWSIRRWMRLAQLENPPIVWSRYYFYGACGVFLCIFGIYAVVFGVALPAVGS